MDVACLMEMSPLLATATPAAHGGASGMTHLMQTLVLQLAIVMIAARIGSLLFSRYFKLPGVLGELSAGMLIGPFALGALPIPGFGPLFPVPAGQLIPVTPELYAIATIASLLLLFLSGLETDLSMFLRYSTVGTAVGIGGVVFSFLFGDLCAVWFGIARSFWDPAALFLGTVSTATSVGITARILTEKKKTDSPEGVTILAGAVLDDVLGIILLAIVVAMSSAGHGQGEGVHWGAIALLAGKTFGWWLLFTVVGIASARRLSAILKRMGSHETISSVALGLAMLLAGLLENVGLAMIIGAYIMGLALSRTDLVHVIQHQLRGAYNLLVPAFFCVMGMLIDFRAMKSVVAAGLVYSVLAILTKILGCGLPALLMKFNLRGAFRIGAGMVPRGEVALIVAGIGLSSGAINQTTFGLAVMMTVLTTLIAPPVLVRAFEGGHGLRHGADERETTQAITLKFPTADVADFMIGRIAKAFQNEAFFVHIIQLSPPVYQMRKDEMSFTVSMEDEGVIRLSTAGEYLDIARFVLLEEVLELKNLAESVRAMKNADSMSDALAEHLFV